jgi:hypothetical protein
MMDVILDEGKRCRPTVPSDRRQILGMLGATIVSLCCHSLALTNHVAETDAIDIRDLLQTVFSTDTLDTAAVVGGDYLATHPDEVDIAHLTALLFGPGSRQPSALSRKVVDRISDDLAKGHMALFSGWVLARTEARLCALAFLYRGA